MRYAVMHSGDRSPQGCVIISKFKTGTQQMLKGELTYFGMMRFGL